jgi:hypothetical protein
MQNARSPADGRLPTEKFAPAAALIAADEEGLVQLPA